MFTVSNVSGARRPAGVLVNISAPQTTRTRALSTPRHSLLYNLHLCNKTNLGKRLFTERRGDIRNFSIRVHTCYEQYY